MTVNDMPFTMLGYFLPLQLIMLPNLHLDTRDGITRPIPTIGIRIFIIDEAKLFLHVHHHIAYAALNNILGRDSQKALVPLAYLIVYWSEDLWTRYTNWLIEFEDTDLATGK